jgi:acyl carrier protein
MNDREQNPAVVDMGEQQAQQVLQYLLDASGVELSLDELSPRMSLRDDLGFDSLTAVELVMELEETFGISLANEEVTNLVTVEDVLRIVETKQRESSA